MSELASIITSADPAVRNRSLDSFCRSASVETLLRECAALEALRQSSDNLYERVRALFFLYAIHRFHLPLKEGVKCNALIPFRGYECLLKRRFEEAIEIFQARQRAEGPSGSISSALAGAYQRLGFQTLADQVRRSVRSVRGNQWMFRVGHPADYPLRIRPELLERASADALFPMLHETTPVRMDLTHSGWSDIFFLGHGFSGRGAGAERLHRPERAGRGGEAANHARRWRRTLRVIDARYCGWRASIWMPRRRSRARRSIRFCQGLPGSAQGRGHRLRARAARHGRSRTTARANCWPHSRGGRGTDIEIVSRVNDIPKGSRLAVSTNLLACLIAVAMRATNQTRSLTGTLPEEDRRVVAARAILGEWLGGSGGGWQDSGGVWPGMKLISGSAGRAG